MGEARAMPASKPSAREGDPASAQRRIKCLAQLPSENRSLARQEPLHPWFIIRNCSAFLTHASTRFLRSKRDSGSPTSLLPLFHSAGQVQPGLSQPGLSARLSSRSLYGIFLFSFRGLARFHFVLLLTALLSYIRSTLCYHL